MLMAHRIKEIGRIMKCKVRGAILMLTKLLGMVFSLVGNSTPKFKRSFKLNRSSRIKLLKLKRGPNPFSANSLKPSESQTKRRSKTTYRPSSGVLKTAPIISALKLSLNLRIKLQINGTISLRESLKTLIAFSKL